MSSHVQSCPVVSIGNWHPVIFSRVQLCPVVSTHVHLCPVMSSRVQLYPSVTGIRSYLVVSSCVQSCPLMSTHVQSCPVAHWSSFLRLEHHQRRSAVASQSSCAAAAIRPIFSPSVISLRSLGRFRSYFAKKIINGTSHCSSSNISSREHGTEAENQDVHSRLTEPSV